MFLGAHLGRDKTYEKLKKRYYWKGMFGDVQDFILKCTPCQRTNKLPSATKPELHPIPVTAVWKQVDRQVNVSLLHGS